MDAETLHMLRSSLNKLLTEESEQSLSSRLRDFGWEEALSDDAPSALRTLFEVKGETVAPGDALGPALARAVAQRLGAGELTETIVVLPSSLYPDRLSAHIEGDRLVVRGMTLSPPTADRRALVPVAGAPALRLAVLPEGVEWTAQASGGTDPDFGLVAVEAVIGQADVTWIDGGPAQDAWDAAVAVGRWALAAELLGIGQHAITQAVAYTIERKQYGRAIGTFQALQHRLAGAYASVVGAWPVIEEAATSGSPWVAMVAKALAGRAAEIACTQAQQAYGAIGFTWEHEFHRYLRRTFVLDWVLGDWRTLEHEMGTRLITTGEVPKIGML